MFFAKTAPEQYREHGIDMNFSSNDLQEMFRDDQRLLERTLEDIKKRADGPTTRRNKPKTYGSQGPAHPRGVSLSREGT